ncbi:unnamed protein product [Heterosigma akashiwo]|mmetsp:Transcript_51151/g.74827  ORF Transcript_51151/g.74827 Transcript_51151/m.74827 type:complete len:179 (+) Transcript_51151:58-594(+)
MDGQPSFIEKLQVTVSRRYQYFLDKSTIYSGYRWGFFMFAVLVYLARVYYANGWFIVTYGLGIYLLNNFIGFLSPQIDPENEGPVLPDTSSDEFRPFTRRVPEFQFWHASTKAVLIAFCMTFFQLFDIPVFWPILLFYFLILFGLTMKRQIKHMLKHGYVPWSRGKARFSGKSIKNSK